MANRKGKTMKTKKIFKKNMCAADEVRTFKNGKLQLVKHEDVVIGLLTLQPGFSWAESIKPIARTHSCELSHIGYVLSGNIKVTMDDGSSEEYGPGDVMILPPKHTAKVFGDKECQVLDFTGMEEFAKPK